VAWLSQGPPGSAQGDWAGDLAEAAHGCGSAGPGISSLSFRSFLLPVGLTPDLERCNIFRNQKFLHRTISGFFSVA
jgi:hypothetical protein